MVLKPSSLRLTLCKPRSVFCPRLSKAGTHNLFLDPSTTWVFQSLGLCLSNTGLQGLWCATRCGPITCSTHLVKPSEASMETVGLSVDGQVVLLPIHRESSFGNSVGYPPNHCSKVGLLLQVTCTDRQGIKPLFLFWFVF